MAKSNEPPVVWDVLRGRINDLPKPESLDGLYFMLADGAMPPIDSNCDFRYWYHGQLDNLPNIPETLTGRGNRVYKLSVEPEILPITLVGRGEIREAQAKTFYYRLVSKD